KNFKGTPENVINFMYFIAQELREIMAQLGFRTMNEMVGQSQKLDTNKAIKHYKAQGIDLSNILFKPNIKPGVPLANTEKQLHNIEGVLDFEILSQAHPAIYRKEPVTLHYPISNTNRTTGTIVSNEISKIHGAVGLPKNTLTLNFKGSAGQSFGAFAAKGLNLNIEGNSNDYFGKGLSGAVLSIRKPKEATFKSHENIIIGNVALYGATNGEAYINGIGGERFCVRNSGAKAVIEGIGDHGCEYMTGGMAVILGKIGRNFAAGMSGGTAYIFDPENGIDQNNFNMEMIELEAPSEENLQELEELIVNHFQYTESELAKEIINNWDQASKAFIKVMPTEYKKALEKLEEDKKKVEEVDLKTV
ncbi:MAG: glutamate synthase subunit alpha, partial [Gramella sp.]|nr:glutamate synthase subunit alpha [Christiangramia sp.]